MEETLYFLLDPNIPKGPCTEQRSRMISHKSRKFIVVHVSVT